MIMVTAHDQDIDKLMALRIGADDYVVKPFNPAEVAARVRAVLRRTRRAEWDGHALLRVGPLEIDLEAFRVAVVAGDASRHVLTLTLTEFRLLAHLARAASGFQPRRADRRPPAGREVLERTVDSHISKLRRKLEEVGVEGMPVSLRVSATASGRLPDGQVRPEPPACAVHVGDGPERDAAAACQLLRVLRHRDEAQSVPGLADRG